MSRRRAFDLLLVIMGALLLCTVISLLADGAFTGSLFVSATVAGVGAINVAAGATTSPRWRPRIRRIAVR